MIALVLSPAGSAPGIENELSELYQIGANLVANVLGQALYAMDVSDHALRAVAGDDINLLIWNRKRGSPTRAGDMRLMQIPSCFRRLVDAALADVVGPIIEPLLSPRQAAIRSCVM